jgi:hypothetical protein
MPSPSIATNYLDLKLNVLKLTVNRSLDIKLFENKYLVIDHLAGKVCWPQARGGQMGTAATLIVRHRVQDYGAWHAVYDTVEGLRQQHGCSAEVMVDPGDKQDVFVLHRFPTVTQAQAFAESSELREAMGRAGVVGSPRIEIAVEA